jgi:copper(I)-binding protein
VRGHPRRADLPGAQPVRRDNTAVGTLALRGLSVEPGGDDRTHEAGEDVEVFLVLTNDDDEADTLVEVTTPDAESVELLVDGEEEPGGIEVPALGSTGNAASLRLVSLTEELREGEYTTLTFRFERNGSIEVPSPCAAPAAPTAPSTPAVRARRASRPCRPPPAATTARRQGGDEDGAGAEGEEGIVGEGEAGQSEDEGETAPRDEESTTNPETSEELPDASPTPRPADGSSTAPARLPRLSAARLRSADDLRTAAPAVTARAPAAPDPPASRPAAGARTAPATSARSAVLPSPSGSGSARSARRGARSSRSRPVRALPGPQDLRLGGGAAAPGPSGRGGRRRPHARAS